MQLLIDTHIFIGFARDTLDATHPRLAWHVKNKENSCSLSIASIWEIAIKTRLGKLDAGLPPDEIVEFCKSAEIQLLPISAAHATELLLPEPLTRDPFDRMLLAQCAVENMKLVTIDRLMAGHPLVLSA
ncbi:MAG: type II toxin-antitoxin system VapC family toxin [Rhizobiaceae bacterium]